MWDAAKTLLREYVYLSTLTLFKKRSFKINERSFHVKKLGEKSILNFSQQTVVNMSRNQ